jgi:LmbE family N-acetylglucosaminyl deacetylase
MPRAPHLALLLLLATPAFAQRIDDPANLMGERVSPPALADILPIDHGAPALEQLLRKLRTRASMMLIVAHPDDEDSGLLTLESRGAGARVAMLTLTRGEGGQNLMTADFNDALGLIRTQELLAEDRYTGTDQFFGTEVDFGFSKTKEESFKMWTHDRVLYDAVRSVRLYRPLVLASVFIGGVTDGHGQHQVSGEISQEVFLAAADPKVFPEMGLPPWAPLRVYARVPFARITSQGMFDYATGKFLPPHFHNYVTGVDTTTPPAATVTIHEGDVPNIPSFEGKSYVQWARQGLALQKTQIGANFHIPPPGRADVGYTLYGTRTPCSPDKRTGCPILSEASPAKGGVSGASPTALPSGSQSLKEPDAPASGIGQSFSPATPASEIGQSFSPATPASGIGQRFSPAKPASEIGQGFSPATPATKKNGASAPETNSSDNQDLFTGIDTSLPSIASLAPAAPASLRTTLTTIDNGIAEAQRLYNPDRLDLTAPPLREALRTLDTLITTTEKSSLDPAQKFNLLHELRIKHVQLNDALILALGITMTARADIESEAHIHRPVAIVGGDLSPLTKPFEVAIILKAAAGDHISLLGLEVDRSPASGPGSSPLEAVHSIRVSARLQNAFGVSRPYFSRNSLEQAFYNIARPSLRNAPASPALAGNARLSDEGVELELSRSIEDDGKPLELVPPVSIAVSPLVQVRPETAAPLPILVHVSSQSAQELDGILRPALPDNWSSQPIDFQLNLKPEVQQARTSFQLQPRRLTLGKSYSVSAVVNLGREAGQWGETYRSIGYPGLPYTNDYTPAVTRIVPVDVTTAPNLRIAYLPGTGDEVPQFLPSLGVTPTILTGKDLTLANLQHYDAILLGVRAYSAHPELEGPGSGALTAYARQGGIVILQYSSAGFNPASAPFPYTIPGDSAHNVVDEDQPVTLLAPANPLLTWPNRITSADFDHWIEERGHGFATDWSPQYTPLLETHDPGQDPQKGGLLLAKVGKGAYLYCAFALYRQLPEGVPGAYRLLANLLSYARNPQR